MVKQWPRCHPQDCQELIRSQLFVLVYSHVSTQTIVFWRCWLHILRHAGIQLNCGTNVRRIWSHRAIYEIYILLGTIYDQHSLVLTVCFITFWSEIIQIHFSRLLISYTYMVNKSDLVKLTISSHRQSKRCLTHCNNTLLYSAIAHSIIFFYLLAIYADHLWKINRFPNKVRLLTQYLDVLERIWSYGKPVATVYMELNHLRSRMKNSSGL